MVSYFGLKFVRWIHKVLCKYLQISGPPEFLNNRTEADEEATAKDAEHAKRMTQQKEES